MNLLNILHYSFSVQKVDYKFTNPNGKRNPIINIEKSDD